MRYYFRGHHEVIAEISGELDEDFRPHRTYFVGEEGFIAVQDPELASFVEDKLKTDAEVFKTTWAAHDTDPTGDKLDAQLVSL